MQKAVFIEGGRNGYHPSQCRTMTVRDLMDALQELADMCGEDAEVFLRNDNGYTYGSVGRHGLQAGCYDGHRVYLEDDPEFDDAFWEEG